jgi:hypothetical protein
MTVFETLERARLIKSRVKALALLTFLVPFSALGAYVQYEDGNMPLAVMYLVLGPIVAAGCWLAWRNALAAWRSPSAPPGARHGRGPRPGPPGAGIEDGDRRRVS